MFVRSRVGLPAVGISIVEDKPTYTQQPSSGPLVDMRGLGTEETNRHYPASGTTLQTFLRAAQLASQLPVAESGSRDGHLITTSGLLTGCW